MSDGYKPTAQVKWFRVEDNDIAGDRPLAQIGGLEWYCLKQLWVSDYHGEPDQWKDVEVVV